MELCYTYILVKLELKHFRLGELILLTYLASKLIITYKFEVQ